MGLRFVASMRYKFQIWETLVSAKIGHVNLINMQQSATGFD